MNVVLLLIVITNRYIGVNKARVSVSRYQKLPDSHRIAVDMTSSCPFRNTRKCTTVINGFCERHWDLVWSLTFFTKHGVTPDGERVKFIPVRTDVTGDVFPILLDFTDQMDAVLNQDPVVYQNFKGACCISNSETINAAIGKIRANLISKNVSKDEVLRIERTLLTLFSDGRFRMVSHCVDDDDADDEFHGWNPTFKQAMRDSVRRVKLSVVHNNQIRLIPLDFLPTLYQVLLFSFEVNCVTNPQLFVWNVAPRNCFWDLTERMLKMDNVNHTEFYVASVPENLYTGLTVWGVRIVDAPARYLRHPVKPPINGYTTVQVQADSYCNAPEP